MITRLGDIETRSLQPMARPLLVAPSHLKRWREGQVSLRR
jgi:hypothetical protein